MNIKKHVSFLNDLVNDIRDILPDIEPEELFDLLYVIASNIEIHYEQEYLTDIVEELWDEIKGLLNDV